ncbi:sigma-70 family RNA polymerase sigma factor [Sporosarcina cascadiensis]|uniref:sigma-70 family RNA polymerase sigma factor n=1 Tax=Sporosarcina cascadiensis TaxID=2660747 RepID=UPI00129A21E3|nr:sigma-70 family RNA polymerase sigma factor [Sporosarcina cascadiensis]
MDIEKVLEEYGDYLLRVAYLYVKDENTAEDIVQDVLLKFYQNETQFKGQSSLKTYLVRMTVNRSHDYLRSWKSKGFILMEKLRITSPRQTPEEQMIHTEENRVLVNALFSMTLIYREVLVLYYYEELSTVEIAEMLGCPEATVRTRLQRARRQLKKRLQNRDGEVMDDGWNER